MVLIQVLLPATLPGETGPVDAHEALAVTRAELVARYEGLTAYVRSPAKGWWTAPDGRTERDDMIMIEVVTDAFDRDWWRAYTATLAARFRQQAIHLRALPVELLDDAP
jgi:hypothetical protein